jgi:hypothetical protein
MSDFDGGPEIKNNDRLQALFGQGNKFFRTVYKSRKEKKPMVVCILKKTDASTIDFII